MTRMSALLSGTAVSLMTLLAAPVVAQTAPAESPPATTVGADEIIVTAQKRTENVQDVPKSVAVASQAQLQAAGVSRLSELSSVSVSLTDTDQSQNAKAPGIRGIASIANSVGVQSQTGIIVDDIPQATFSTLANELSDIERIEVFAGPQSTLSGRNAAGGIINIVTRNPTAEPTGEFNVMQTTDHQTRITGFVSAPLGDQLGFSLSGVYNDWGGPFRNALLNNRRMGGYETYSVRGKLRWEPSEALTVTLTGYYVQTDRTTAPILGGGAYVKANPTDIFVFDALGRPFSTLYPGITAERGNRTIFSPEIGIAKTRDKGGTLRLDYDAGTIGTFSSLTSYTRSHQPRRDVFVGAPRNNLVFPLTDFGADTDVDTKYWTQEVRLASPGTGPVTYLLGAIYTDTGLTQPYQRLQLFAVDWDRTTSIKSGAVFGRATWKFTESDSVTGGLRYQHDKLGYTWQFNPLGPTDPANLSRGSSSYGFFSGEVSLKHDFSPDVNVYATFSHAETGKAYDVEDNGTAGDKIVILPNGSTQVTPGQPLTPLNSEKVNNIEIGLKSQLFDRRLTFNVNGFYAKYKDYQIQTIDLSCGQCVPVIRLFAVGGVETKGVEVSTSFRGVENLNLAANLAYTDTTITSYPGNEAREGNTLPNAAKWKATISADYTIPLESAPFDIDLGVFYRYQSKVFFNLDNNVNQVENSYSVVNVYAGLSTHDDRYRLQFFVNNLFNKHYYTSLLTEPLFAAAGFAGPGSEVSANYDRNSFRYGGVRLSAKF